LNIAALSSGLTQGNAAVFSFVQFAGSSLFAVG
jgi:hypothetical protein